MGMDGCVISGCAAVAWARGAWTQADILAAIAASKAARAAEQAEQRRVVLEGLERQSVARLAREAWA